MMWVRLTFLKVLWAFLYIILVSCWISIVEDNKTHILHCFVGISWSREVGNSSAEFLCLWPFPFLWPDSALLRGRDLGEGGWDDGSCRGDKSSRCRVVCGDAHGSVGLFLPPYLVSSRVLSSGWDLGEGLRRGDKSSWCRDPGGSGDGDGRSCS